jgi:Spy/CpxP family protein refolding chaperone
MKKNNFTTLILKGLLFVFAFSTANAQQKVSPADAAKQEVSQKSRPNLLAELNLSQNQIQQIRSINQENNLKRREAQFRVKEAQKALDQAIYADSADETVIQTKLKDLQLAQAEIIKLRSMTEFAVRKVLTPEQLLKFREVRQNFIENRGNRFNQPKNRPFNNPDRPFNERRRRLRPGS